MLKPIMHHYPKYVLLGCITGCIAMCSGCMSSRIGEGLGPVIFEAALEPVFGEGFGPALDLDLGANEFRVAKGRWPEDFPELVDFLKDSDSAAYKEVQAARFSRIEFSNAPNGQLGMSVELPMPPAIHTASGVTATISGGTMTLKMTLPPTDPREIKKISRPKTKKPIESRVTNKI